MRTPWLRGLIRTMAASGLIRTRAAPLLWLLVIGALLLPGAAVAAQRLDVFVSILPQKYFVQRVGGVHVAVSVMVGPGQSPATYAPSPRQIVALSSARVYFRIGVPFEDAWMGRIEAANPRMQVVDLRKGIKLRRMPAVHGEGHGAEGLYDPHIWTSPPLVRIMAAHIRDTLIRLDPAHRADYEANYRRFAADIDRLDAQIRAQLAHATNRRFMDFHPSWGYFAAAYGLQQIPIEEGGKEPGARALADVIDKARADHIRVVFVQKQFSEATGDAVASAIGGKVVAVDPLAEDWMNNLRRVAAAFARGMGNSP